MRSEARARDEKNTGKAGEGSEDVDTSDGLTENQIRKEDCKDGDSEEDRNGVTDGKELKGLVIEREGCCTDEAAEE